LTPCWPSSSRSSMAPGAMVVVTKRSRRPRQRSRPHSQTARRVGAQKRTQSKPKKNPVGFSWVLKTKPRRKLTRHHTPNTSHQTPVIHTLREQGIADTNPGHLDLLRLIEAKATHEEFVGAALEAVRKNKGFAYAIGIVKRRREELANPLHQGAMPATQHRPQTQREADAVTAGYMTGAIPMPGSQPRPNTDHTETIDVESRLIAP
jgi:hypothetical protein